MTREQWEEQASLQVLGALPPDEARAFEEQLRADPELRAFYAGMQEAAKALILNVEQTVPPAALKSRILAAIHQPAPEKIIPFRLSEAGRRTISFEIPWALAACLAILAGGLFWHNLTLRSRVTELTAEQTKSQQQTAMLETALTELRAKDRISQVTIAKLGSLLENSPKASAVSVWDPDQQEGVLVVQGLASIAADQDYQLWVVDPKQANPVDGGVFSVDDKGAVRFHFKPKVRVSAATTFAVSLEKKGSVPVAQGPMVLAGKPI